MSSTNPKVDEFLTKAKKWREEMAKLRSLLLDFEFVEELKWSKPCYTVGGSNVVLIVPFKDSVALLFTKGALINDVHGVLFQPTENTQAARQFKFTSEQQIGELESVIKTYVGEAIAAEKSGVKVELKAIAEREVPAEFQARLDENPALKTAFDKLTPGRRRLYLMHFADAKQVKTRESRIEKCIPLILDGKGLND